MVDFTPRTDPLPVNENMIAEALGEAISSMTPGEPDLFKNLPDTKEIAPVPVSGLHIVQLLQGKGVRAAPVTLFFGITFGIYGPVWNELMKTLVCRNLYNHSDVFCDQVGRDLASAAADNEIRATTTDYLMYASLISALPSVIFTFFMGPWSDRHGRKIPMAFSIGGYILACALTIPISYNLHVNPLYLLFAAALNSILGGWPVMVSSINSYVGDHTDEKSRSAVLAINMGGLGAGLSAGLTLGTAVLESYGFPAAFFLYLALNCASLLYVIIVIRDHVDFHTKTDNHGMSTTDKFKGIFQMQSLKDNWNMIRRKRTGNTKFFILLLLVGYMAGIMCIENEMSLLQQLTEYQPIGWTVVEYGRFSSIQGFVSCVVLVILIPVFKRLLKMTDTGMGVISSLSGIFCAYGYAVSVTTWMIYVSMSFGLVRQLSFISCQSVLISLINRDEIGKLMSIVGIIQSISQIIGVVLFLKIFAATAVWWPGFVLAVQAFMLVLPLISFCTVNAMSSDSSSSTSEV